MGKLFLPPKVIIIFNLIAWVEPGRWICSLDSVHC